MRLTAIEVKKAAPQEKAYKMADWGGLYLLVNKDGGKYWRYDYRFQGKRKTLAFGVYPEISLKVARELHLEARECLAGGDDPVAKKRQDLKLREKADLSTFQSVADEWFEYRMTEKSQSYRVRSLRILQKDLYPSLGRRPIDQIDAPELLAVLRKIERRSVDIAHRAKQLVGLIFKYAIAVGKVSRNPSAELTGVLRDRKVEHYPTIVDPKQVANLLVAIDGYQGGRVVKTALQLSILTFQRPGHLRHVEWREIDWSAAQWVTDADKMSKTHRAHIVPLSRQALTHLEQLFQLTGTGRYVFPGERGRSRPISDNAVRTALRTLGYSNEEIVPHGFRALARTMLDEQLGYRVEWIEHQLAHAVKDPTGRAYNRTSFLPQRAKMMQGWADYLDSLRGKLTAPVTNVIPFIRGGDKEV